MRGEAGIGKTRLAQELATRAISENAMVLWERCYEGEANRTEAAAFANREHLVE